MSPTGDRDYFCFGHGSIKLLFIGNPVLLSKTSARSLFFSTSGKNNKLSALFVYPFSNFSTFRKFIRRLGLQLVPFRQEDFVFLFLPKSDLPQQQKNMIEKDRSLVSLQFY